MLTFGTMNEAPGATFDAISCMSGHFRIIHKAWSQAFCRTNDFAMKNVVRFDSFQTRRSSRRFLIRKSPETMTQLPSSPNFCIHFVSGVSAENSLWSRRCSTVWSGSIRQLMALASFGDKQLSKKNLMQLSIAQTRERAGPPWETLHTNQILLVPKLIPQAMQVSRLERRLLLQ